MSYHYRCTACRGRNTLPRALRDYKRRRRCKHCPSVGRFYVDKERVHRKSCTCKGAYHWGPHRPGSPMCELNPFVNANRARREGAGDDVIARLIQEAYAMHEQPGLDGIEEAPAVTALQVAVVGMLWKPARLVVAGAETVLEAWLVQPASSLPVYACRVVDSQCLADVADLRDAEQRLQRIGTPVLARGFGIQPAIAENRECLRIGFCSYVDVVPAEQRLAA